MLDARYMAEVPNHTQSEEMFVLCPFWDLFGLCDMQTRLNGRAYDDRNHNQFRGTKECEIAVLNIGEYGII